MSVSTGSLTGKEHTTLSWIFLMWDCTSDDRDVPAAVPLLQRFKMQYWVLCGVWCCQSSAWGFSLEISAPHALMHSTSLDKTESLVLPVICLRLLPGDICTSCSEAFYILELQDAVLGPLWVSIAYFLRHSAKVWSMLLYLPKRHKKQVNWYIIFSWTTVKNRLKSSVLKWFK